MWIALLAAISAPWFRIPVDNADSAGMEAHLHGLFEARDLLYDDEYAALQMSPLFAFVTERGVVSNHWPVGASFVQAPGWLLGRLAGMSLVGTGGAGGAGGARAAGSGGISTRAAMWTLPLLGLRCWALLVLAFVSMVVQRWLAPKVGARMAWLTVAALVVGTPLLYYASESPLRPHLWGAAVVTLLTLRWFDAIEHAVEDPERARASWRVPLELSLLAGLAAAIRPQLAMLALLVAHERWLASAELGVVARLRLLLSHGLACALAFSIWPALVVRMQLWMYGGVSDYAGEVSHHVQAFLLSTHHGALIWCPVLLLGALGLAIGLAARERGALLLILILAAQVWLDAGTREIEPYTVLGTRTWTGGTAFGPRKLLDAMPLMLPGVVWLSAWLREQDDLARRSWTRRLTAVTCLSLAVTLALLAAAFIDPAVCSEVLDGERLSIALGLGFDPSNWALAIGQRSLPLHVTLRLALIVGVPLALLVMLALGWRALPGPGPARVRSRVAVVALLITGLAAHGWLWSLERRSAALLEADPQRMRVAAASMNPWHEAMVAEIPRQQALLNARLGPH